MVTSVRHLERVEWNLSQFHYSRLFGTSTYAFKAKMCKMQDSEMPFESFMSGWFEKKQAHANFLAKWTKSPFLVFSTLTITSAALESDAQNGFYEYELFYMIV